MPCGEEWRTPLAALGARNRVSPELCLQRRDIGALEKQRNAIWILIMFSSVWDQWQSIRLPLPLSFDYDLLRLSRLSDTFANSHTWNLRKKYPLILIQLGFPGGAVVRICLQCRRCRFDSWVGKIPRSRKWQPTPVFLPGKLNGQRSLSKSIGLQKVGLDWVHI